MSSASAVTNIPNSFLAGYRDRLSPELIQLLYNGQSSTAQAAFKKQDTIGSPPANFLSTPGITQTAREASWGNLTDDQRAAYRAGTSGQSSSGIISSQPDNQTYSVPGFNSVTGGGATASALVFSNARGSYLNARSATPSNATLTAYTKVFPTQAKLDQVLSSPSSNGAAVFFDVRSGLSSNPGETATSPYAAGSANDKIFQDQLKAQASQITARFGAGGQGLLGYDVNGDGKINDENELIGFLPNGTPSPALAAILPELRNPGDRIVLGNNPVRDNRLFFVGSDGNSIRLNQSAFATSALPSGGYTPYTTAQTVLQVSESGTLELVAYTGVGFTLPGGLDKTSAVQGTVTAGTGANRATNPFAAGTAQQGQFETQVDTQVTAVAARFGGLGPVTFGYDANGDGTITADEDFSGSPTALNAPARSALNALNAYLAGDGAGQLNLAQQPAGVAASTFDVSKLFAKTSSGSFVPLNQTSTANASGVTTTAQTVLSGYNAAGASLTIRTLTQSAVTVRAGGANTSESAASSRAPAAVAATIQGVETAATASVSGLGPNARLAIDVNGDGAITEDEVVGSRAASQKTTSAYGALLSTLRGLPAGRDLNLANGSFVDGATTYTAQRLFAVNYDAATGTVTNSVNLGSARGGGSANVTSGSVSGSVFGQAFLELDRASGAVRVVGGSSTDGTLATVRAGSFAAGETVSATDSDVVAATTALAARFGDSPLSLVYDANGDGAFSGPTELLSDPSNAGRLSALKSFLDGNGGRVVPAGQTIGSDANALDLSRLFGLSQTGALVSLNQANQNQVSGAGTNFSLRSVLQYNQAGGFEVVAYSRPGASFLL